jgi:hypothetical protein
VIHTDIVVSIYIRFLSSFGSPLTLGTSVAALLLRLRYAGGSTFVTHAHMYLASHRYI